MPRSYEQAVATRSQRLSPAEKAQARVFEGAYAIAMEIVALREKLHMTQAQLAEKTGIDQGDISRIERGSSLPNEKTLLRIADALGAQLRLVERISA